jgi:hypothetical protein
MTIYALNTLRPVVGFTYVPDSMEARGEITPKPPFPGVTNGLGEAVRAGWWGFEWRFSSMSNTEMLWWKAILGYTSGSTTANISKRFVQTGEALPAARLWDTTGIMVDYKVAVVYLPTWTTYKNGRFQECVVKFTHLEEA